MEAAWKNHFVGQADPGAGVVVVQPDTGHRSNGALQTALGKERLGWDFLKNDEDAIDETDPGALQNPGHGTRTGSVLAGSNNYKLSNAANKVWVSGVAPGVTWIPLRVSNRVSLVDRAEYDVSNLASAIRHASGGNRTLVKRQADVISISLGGTPQKSLEEAIAMAEKAGVIVIAAAGNYVKAIVWPASYNTVVSVVATNYDQRLWKDSSYLPTNRITIAAPGEDVWTAVSDRTKTGFIECIAPGTGTSYATATMAGIAALWIAKHQSKTAFRALRQQGVVPKTFRDLLPNAVRVPDNWNKQWGRGIIDADKLLGLALPGETSGK